MRAGELRNEIRGELTVIGNGAIELPEDLHRIYPYS
jgi:hypothetical protein